MSKLFSFLVLSVFTFSFSHFSHTQEMKITGIVYDSTGTTPLKNALAMAVRVKDSLLLGFARSDEQGKFTLTHFAPDTFSLLIEHPKFDNKTYYIFGHQENWEIDIPKIIMSIRAKQLEDVVIYANKSPIYYKGDTLVYVADSFQVGENAVVEDLLKKLPGVKVDKDGKITSQGKSISQVLVDGDEFFGSDPTIATKNLAAKGVESVKVYEKKSETLSEGEDATIQVMDLRLKEDAKNGYFGKTSLASDFQEFHEGELLFNKFQGSQKISVFGLGSTTPRTNVSRADMNKFGLDNGSSRNSMNSDGMMSWNGNNEKAAGVPTTFSGGIYYSDKIGKKKQTKIGLNYTYNNYQLVSSGASRSKYALPTDTSYYTDDSTHNIDLSQSHSVNFKLFSQIDSLTTFEIRPRLTTSTGDQKNATMASFIEENGITESRNSLIDNSTISSGLSLDNEATFVRKFMKPRRQMTLNYELEASAGSSTGTLDSYNQYFSAVGIDDTINQVQTNKTSSQTHVGRAIYAEPISKKMKVELEYLYEYGFSGQNKQTKNGLNGIYTEINTALTNNFENLRVQNRAGTALIYESRIHMANIGLRMRNIDIENKNITTGIVIHQNINNFLPKFTYSFKPSPSKRFNVNYNTKSAQPSVNDLQLVQNNTNPNRIKVGNPDLKPTYEHSLSVGFNHWQALSGRYIYGRFSSSITNNAFADSTLYDNYGRTISQTVNVDGNVFAMLMMGGGVPILNKSIEISPGFNTSYFSYSSWVDGNKNTTTTQAATGEMALDFDFDSLQFTLEGKYTYNNPTNSITSLASSPYSLQEYSASFTWKLPGNFKIGSDASYTINSQRAAGYNLNYFVWNATISKNFLKTENLVLSLIGNDILNQNISAARTINGNITTDNRTKIISRYFLLKLVYKFNNNKIREEDARSGWH